MQYWVRVKKLVQVLGTTADARPMRRQIYLLVGVAIVAPSMASTAVVGGGIAGLRCALALARAGEKVTIFESSDGVGGRVRSDTIDGFTLDRGFQVFLTAYPEYAGCLDLDELQLRNFWPGAIVQLGGGRSTLVADPTRSSVSTLLPTLTTPLGTIADKLRLGIAVLQLKFLTSISAIFERDEVSTDEHLRSRLQLSDGIVHSFFRPFFRGIFLAPLAKQSSILFEFVLRMFLDGSAALPDGGMGSVPAQLARNVVASGGTIECGTAIAAIKLGAPHELQTADGRTITCDRLVLATPRREADRLLGETDAAAGGEREEELYTSTALYFALDGPPPVSEPLLVLNGQTEGLLNNVCFPSTVSASYAPEGKSLASVTVIGEPSDLLKQGSGGVEGLEARVRTELSEWFGSAEVATWRHLRTYTIRGAQIGPFLGRGGFNSEPRASRGVYRCGDYCASPSLNGALRSGRVAAEALLEDRGL